MAVGTIARWTRSRFPETLPDRLRPVQRVAEYPIVLPNGWPVPVHRLWPILQADGDLKAEMDGETIVALRGPEYTYRTSVGWGMVQVITGPVPDLHELRRRHEAAVARLVDAAASINVALLGYGAQPMSPGHPGLLTRRPLYEAALEALGKPWLTLTLTASDQLRVPARRGELLDLVNLGGLMAPAVIALCGDSPIYNMVDSYYSSGRDQMMRIIHEEHERFGFPTTPCASLEDRVERVGRMPRLVTLDDEGAYAPHAPAGQSFLDFVEAAPDVQASPNNLIGAWLLHEGMTWPAARADPLDAVVELRAACQQPWDDHMVACALNLGIIEAGMDLHDFFFAFMPAPRAPRVPPGVRQPPDPVRIPWDGWPLAAWFYPEAVKKGLGATEPFTGLLEGTIRIAEDTLRARGLGEEIYLAPLWDRLARRENPAQQIRSVFHRQGIQGLIAARRIPSPA